MVIRDLTLRSAASFGSFHLIRLLYDEYMFYLVEHRVAQATGETPIGVMGEVRDSTHTHTLAGVIILYRQTYTMYTNAVHAYTQWPGFPDSLRSS